MVLPKNFGKYDVVGVLGAGAMGTVYDGLDPVIGRRVAIKTVVKHSLDASEAQEMLDRFKQEAQAAGRLNHPGVCAIYDYGETDYVAYIAMEYISGKELKSYFDEGVRFDLKEIVRIMTEMLEALDHAHRNKVVHRDIKPANIMITEDGRVKVADFGVAKLESSMLTQVGTKVGTPAYMSPEQHKGLAVDGRSDLFSCGVILYQFLTGTRPFAGGSQTVAREIMNSTPRLPSEINTSLSPIWDAIANKALAKRRDQRFPTAREFKDALAQALQQSPQGAGLPSSASQNPSSGKTGNTGRSAVESISEQADRSHLAMESELEFWKEIKDSDVAEDFAAFVDSFPEGRFSHLARRRLEKLRGSPPTLSPKGGPSLATPGGSPASAPANVSSEGGVSEDQTLLSSSSAKVVAVEAKSETPQPAMQAPAGLSGQGTNDVDATLVQSKASAAPDEDVDATLVQGREQSEGDGSVSEEAFPDESSAEVIDLDLLGGTGPEAVTGDAPTGSVVASSPPPETLVPAAQKVVTDSTPAPVAEVRSPAVPPNNTSAAKSTVEKEAASVVSDSSPSESAGPSAAERAALNGVAPALSPVSSRQQAEASVSAAVPVPAPEDKVQIASVGATTAPIPPSRTTQVEEPSVPAKKTPVAVIAGLAIALIAGGAWLAFGPGTTPSSTGPATASRDAIPAQGQDASGSSGAGASAQDASRPASATRQDNSKHGEAEKSLKGSDQKKSEKQVDEKVAAKGASDGASSGKQAEEKAASDRRVAERLAAEKAAAEKAVAEKAAAEKAAAEKAAAEKAAAEKAAAEKAAAEKAVADKAAADKAAADKAIAEKAAASKAAAAAASAAGSIADRIAAASAPAELYKRAVALRSEGKTSQAVPLLRQASSQGHGPSSRLLVSIFTEGSGDVRANFREAERYKEIADKQGDR